MILDWTKREVALFLAGSHSNIPTYFSLGSGSGTAVGTQVELLNYIDRQEATSATGSTIYKVKFQGDWNSSEMSGLSLREWGVNVSGTAFTGSMWSRSTMNALLEFEGTTELRIEENWEVY